MARIYLDHAATSPLRPQAEAAMREGFAMWANPSSPHAEGRAARRALEDARARVKAALGWEGEVIFTSGASEALAIGLGRAKVDRRIASAAEHDAVFRAAPGAEVLTLAHGRVDADTLARSLAMPGRAIVAVQHINSETGTFILGGDDPVLAAVRAAGGLLLCDCSQSAGKFPLPTADMLVLSAHKFGGPIGIGALLVRDFAMLEPAGGHERGYRAGTENLPGALGMAAALEAGGLESWGVTARQQADFGAALGQAGALLQPGEQSPHILAVTHPALSAQAALIRLDGLGFAVSAGSACSSGSLKPSRVLQAFGVENDAARRTIRVSLGWNTAPAELDAFAEAWKSLK